MQAQTIKQATNRITGVDKSRETHLYRAPEVIDSNTVIVPFGASAEVRRFCLNLLDDLDTLQSFVPTASSNRTGNAAVTSSQANAAQVTPPQTFEWTLRNEAGRQERFTATPTRRAGNFILSGEDGHELKIDLEQIPADQHEGALTKLAIFYSHVPIHHRDTVNKIEFRAARNQRAAADYQHGHGLFKKIRFHNGLENLNIDTFMHEWGHSVAQDQDDKEDNILEAGAEMIGFGAISGSGSVPEGWKEARRRDGKSVSEYAETNWHEDFAESWMLYASSRRHSDRRLRAFRAEYPNTSVILDELWENRR